MNLSIRAQLMGGFTIIIVLLIAVFGVSFMGMNSMAAATDEIVHQDVPADVAVRELEVLILEQLTLYADFGISRNPDDIGLIDHEIEQVEEHVASLGALFGHDPEVDALIETFNDEYTTFLHTGDLFIEVAQHLPVDEVDLELVELLHELEAEEAEMLLELEELASIAEERVEHAASQAKSAENNAILFATVLAVIALISAVVIATILIRKITGGLKAVELVATDMSEHTLPQLVSHMERAAAGDLTAVFSIDAAKIDDDQNDEIGKIKRAFNRILEAVENTGGSYNKMVAEISGVVGKVRDMSNELAAASGQLAEASSQAGDATQGLADASQQVASGAQEQATNIQKASSIVDDLIRSVGLIGEGSEKQTTEVARAQGVVSQVANASKQVAENAQSANEGAQSANAAAENGVGVVQKTIEGMNSINHAVQNVASEVSNLGERSQEIGKILSISHLLTSPSVEQPRPS